MNFLTRGRFACARTLWGLMALAAVLGCGGCSKGVTYTYVRVHVMIDQQTVSRSLLGTIVGCEFQVLGAEVTDGFPLRCPENQVLYDVGTFSWTSNATTGSLQFRVRVFAVNRVVVGEATSEAIPVSPGKSLTTEVLVLGIPITPEPDAGTDATSPTEAGVESGGADDGGTDLGSDGAVSPDVPIAETGLDLAPDQSNDLAPDAGTSDGPAADTAADGTDATAPLDALDATPDAPASDGPVDVAADGG